MVVLFEPGGFVWVGMPRTRRTKETADAPVSIRGASQAYLLYALINSEMGSGKAEAPESDRPNTIHFPPQIEHFVMGSSTCSILD